MNAKENVANMLPIVPVSGNDVLKKSTIDEKITIDKDKKNKNPNIVIENNIDTISPELKRTDEKRGKLEDLKEDLETAKMKYSETGEELYNNKIKGLTAKIENLEKEIKEDEEKIKKEEEEIKKIQESFDNMILEAKDIEDEIKPIVNELNRKGYTVKYASPGHKKLRKKEDKEPDGVYYKKLYSDARVMFDDDYNLDTPPKYWHFRNVDGCTYLDISPFDFDNKKGNPDEAFDEWKKLYMDSLKDFANSLPDLNKKEMTIESIIEESAELFFANSDLYEEGFLSSFKAKKDNHNTKNVDNIKKSIEQLKKLRESGNINDVDYAKKVQDLVKQRESIITNTPVPKVNSLALSYESADEIIDECKHTLMNLIFECRNNINRLKYDEEIIEEMTEDEIKYASIYLRNTIDELTNDLELISESKYCYLDNEIDSLLE